ncbi:MAG TPA: hypothetical protein VFP65_18165 [Anaeromyxobacteraceae bacterium]|nr:hypothetical protein [Anaeromyxobacteraceae bacterium]
MERELIALDVDALSAALEEERFRHVAGIERRPGLAAVFDARSRAAHRRTVDALREAGAAELAAKVAALRAERWAAEDEEAWRAAESAAVVEDDLEGPRPLAEVEASIAGERNRRRRRTLASAAAAVACPPAREAAVEGRALARAEVGLAPDWEEVVAADALLSASDDAYREVLTWHAQREADLAPAPAGDLTRADLLFVLALHPWRGLFPPGMLALVVERTAAALRLDLGRIRVDDGARPAQWAGAHACGRRVSLRRRGGAGDWLDLVDAVGRALAAAAHPAHLRHPAAAATAGALLSGLLLDRGFLGARLGVERKHARDLVRALALRQLFRLRTAAAALRVASEVERGTKGAAWHERHREALSLAALATWPTGLAARDGDAGVLLATLRGAARAEVVRRSLVERHDEDWWKNPRSADAVGSLLAAGGTWAGDEPPLRVASDRLVALLG